MYNSTELRKKFFNYIIPSVTAMWVFSIYTMVDGIFVSRGVGPTALAAVNISMPFINLIFAISMFFSTGVSTIIAIYLGQNKLKKAKEVFTFTILTMTIVSIVIIIFAIANLDSIAGFLGATETTLPLVTDYLKIIILFNGFFIVSYCLELLTKTDGFPHLAIIGMSMAALTNVILDYIFVIKLQGGVKGAALATGLTQMLSCLFFLYHFLSSKSKLKFVRFKWRFTTLRRILSIGFPDAITELTSGIVILLFNQSILKYIGENGVVTYSVICYVNTLVIMTMIGITQGMQPLCSYYYGKEEQSTVRKLLNLSLKTVGIVSILICVISVFYGQHIVSVFIPKSNHLLFSESVAAFKTFSLSFLLLGFNVLISGFCAALEQPLNATIISLGRGLVIIVICLFSMIAILGGNGIWLATLISEALCLILSILILRKTFSSLGYKLYKEKN